MALTRTRTKTTHNHENKPTEKVKIASKRKRESSVSSLSQTAPYKRSKANLSPKNLKKNPNKTLLGKNTEEAKNNEVETAKAETESRQKVKGETKSKLKVKAESKLKVKVKTESKLTVKAETKSKLKAETKSKLKVKVETESKLTVKAVTVKAETESKLKQKAIVKVTELDMKRAMTTVVGGVKRELNNNVEKSVRERMFVGAHVSIAGGIEHAPKNAQAVGARAFALFLRNQRTWNCKPMEAKSAEKFKTECRMLDFTADVIVPHGSYLLNCGAPNEETLQKSRLALIDELTRCEMLGLNKYNFHPGSTCGKISIDECLDRIGESINQAHIATKYCTTLVENMSCQGNTIGGKFEELRGIIERVKDKTRIGVCLDTCHAMAAGYDLSQADGYEKMMSDFDNIIGLKYLQAVHLNDSKGAAGCHLDRHENIGRGKIGKDGFRRLMQDARLENIPMVLETPPDVDDIEEVKLLYSFIE